MTNVGVTSPMDIENGGTARLIIQRVVQSNIAIGLDAVTPSEATYNSVGVVFRNNPNVNIFQTYVTPVDIDNVGGIQWFGSMSHVCYK